MPRTQVRICVCGDDATGKSSLIATFVKNRFTPGKITPVLPPVTLPPIPGIDADITIIDTSNQHRDRMTLRKEIRKSNVILLVYSNDFTYDRVTLFWMPYFRSLAVNVPVILCATKCDLYPEKTWEYIRDTEMLPVMNEFREIDCCVRASAKEVFNLDQIFVLCAKAILHPIAPLYDHRERELKPACVDALRTIFFLWDRDQDGYLGNHEWNALTLKVCEQTDDPKEWEHIKETVAKVVPSCSTEQGLDLAGWLYLHKLWAVNGQHQMTWQYLRKHHYTDSLSLEDSFLHPKFDVPEFASAELSPDGYRFFMDLFLTYDKDNDGGLNDQELEKLFAPTPGLPASWLETSFPSCTVRNEAGHITLQGWLAQWSMTTFLEPKTTLEYLAYLGFEPPKPKDQITAALKITKPRKRRRRPGRVERNVVLCYVLGSSGAGKSTLLDTFLGRPRDPLYHPTLKPRRAVNSVELPGGKQCYLILEELGELEPAILENKAKLAACDLICYAYDSSNPDSFSHIVDLRSRYPDLDELPAVYTALKADLDKTTQRSELQPEAYTESLNMSTPLHHSVNWDSISELWVALAEAATNPSTAFPKTEAPVDRTSLYMALGATTCAGLAVALIWRRSTNAS